MSGTHTFVVQFKVHVSADDHPTREDAAAFLADARRRAEHQTYWRLLKKGAALVFNEQHVGEANLVGFK
jgi:hypothetical protein